MGTRMDYSMFIECTDKGIAERLKQRFESFEVPLQSGVKRFTSGHLKTDYNQGICVSSVDLGHGNWETGPGTLKNALDFTKATIHLMHRLLSAPDFEFAFATYDAVDFGMPDLEGWIENFGENTYINLRIPGAIVLTREIYETLGKPSGMIPFREGYCWTGVRGFTYDPMRAIDQTDIRRLYEELLPTELKHARKKWVDAK